jgi:hypothetical protein
MKKLVAAIALTLAAATAHAGIIATIPNKAGSTIKLTDGKTSTCNGDWHLLYATADTGRTTTGCWMFNSDVNEIVAVYEDGTTYTYPTSAITLTKYFNARYSKENK